MKRQSFRYNIPQEYIDNEAKGLCRVCGKKPEGRRTKHCSKDCADKYAWLFTFPVESWEDVRQRIITRANKECEQCGVVAIGGARVKLEVDHKVALCNGGEMWDEDNLWALCHACHVEKTAIDMSIKRDNEKS